MAAASPSLPAPTPARRAFSSFRFSLALYVTLTPLQRRHACFCSLEIIASRPAELCTLSHCNALKACQARACDVASADSGDGPEPNPCQTRLGSGPCNRRPHPNSELNFGCRLHTHLRNFLPKYQELPHFISSSLREAPIAFAVIVLSTHESRLSVHSECSQRSR